MRFKTQLTTLERPGSRRNSSWFLTLVLPTLYPSPDGVMEIICWDDVVKMFLGRQIMVLESVMVTRWCNKMLSDISTLNLSHFTSSFNHQNTRLSQLMKETGFPEANVNFVNKTQLIGNWVLNYTIIQFI